MQRMTKKLHNTFVWPTQGGSTHTYSIALNAKLWSGSKIGIFHSKKN